MKKVRINQGRIIQWQFRLLLTIVILSVIFYCMSNLSEIMAISVSILMSFLLPPMWSAFYILEIDPNTRTISTLIWVLGERNRSSENYNELEKIFINTGNYSQRMTSHGGRVHEQKVKRFTAFLKTDEGKKHFLISGEDEESLLEKLALIEKRLGCPIVKNY